MKPVCIAIGVLLVLARSTPAGDLLRTNSFRAESVVAAQAWQEATRDKLFSLMMGGARPGRVPLEAKTLQRVENADPRYVLEEINVQSLPDRRAHAWLARPRQPHGKAGVVLAIHGHGGSGEEIVRGQSLYWSGRAMAELGYLVVAPDVGQHDLQHSTWSLMGERTWDAIRCLDYALTLPEADPEKVAVAGLSLGGETTMYVAALDERVKLACSSGWLTTVANMKNGHCPCFNFPGLEQNFDFSDIFACVAPRTLVCELGEQERAPGGFPISIGRRAYEQIQTVYRVFHAPSNAVFTVHSAGHVFNGRDFWPRLAALMSPAAISRSRTSSAPDKPDEQTLWALAENNGHLAAEGLTRCRRYVDGWLAQADPTTGLIPRNLTVSRDFWNGRDSAADNYPFMVLTAALTDRALLDGRLLDMLRTETRITCRVDRLPDDYSFSKKTWRREQLNLDEIIFDGAEYVKDGLLPITEWLGASPWSERMVGILDDIWKNAGIDTPFGKISTLNFEVNGDLLQACARVFWFTGDRKYLDWGMRLADYYLLGTQHPTRDQKELRLIDHGCEVINGLSEIYLAASRAAPQKRSAYQAPLHALLDRVLELGRNPDGLLYTSINPQVGQHSSQLSDTWGYVYDAFYTVYLLDQTEAYREAIRHVLQNLKGKYVGAPWSDISADGFADSIEGALNLFNREPIPEAAEWIDNQTRLMWSMQKSDGIIEGWHGDGNFARTTLMYVLWKTQGVHVQPWRADVRVGAVRDGDDLLIFLAADQPWSGQLVFDQPRHRTNLHLPIDYPRINQFPEWFTVDPEKTYQVQNLNQAGLPTSPSGRQLTQGWAQEIAAGTSARLRVTPARP